MSGGVSPDRGGPFVRECANSVYREGKGANFWGWGEGGGARLSPPPANSKARCAPGGFIQNWRGVIDLRPAQFKERALTTLARSTIVRERAGVLPGQNPSGGSNKGHNTNDHNLTSRREHLLEAEIELPRDKTPRAQETCGGTKGWINKGKERVKMQSSVYTARVPPKQIHGSRKQTRDTGRRHQATACVLELKTWKVCIVRKGDTWRQ